ncbi:MAG: Holliday junction branch migration protein RuvA [Bryobacteraceae bacterium]|nr:Holliday junction branch migration protein RuvA [Bryobacteraceae bacterium]
MIAHLRGRLLEKHPNQAIVDCHGVGYDVSIPVSTFSALPDSGIEIHLRIHTHVREDAIALFGFHTLLEKALFEKLIGISGIGPALAIKVLSGLNTTDLVQSIRSGDVGRLQKIPGVGKKTAERMVLELREKLENLGAPIPLNDKVVTLPVSGFTATEEDVLSALGNLGCTRPAAEGALAKAKQASDSHEFETLFRKALELLR